MVDDEPHVRNVMALKLRGAGYTVETAADGEEGLNAVAERRPDLIISDFQMPRLNGLQMCWRLAADPSTLAIPIILLTSRDFDVTDRDRTETGIRAVKNKPFSPKDILKAVEQILSPPGAAAGSAAA